MRLAADINMSTEQLCDQWVRQMRYALDTQRKLLRAEQALVDCANEVGRRLAPHNMLIGETVGVWTRVDSEQELCVMITKLGDDCYTCEARR